jgi:TorA maturation chaperone TorD
MSEDMRQDWINKAALYELLAFSLRLPSDELAKVLASGEYTEALQEILALNSDTISLESSATSAAKLLAQYQGKDPEELKHTLRIEYTRLFVGAPTPAVSPYAGVWQAERDGVEPLLFVNKESMAVERLYHSIGVGQPKDTNEPLDHIATELEFLQYLCLLKAEAVLSPEGIEVPETLYADFLAEHVLTWLPDFAKKLLASTELPFFSVVAGLLLGLV